MSKGRFISETEEYFALKFDIKYPDSLFLVFEDGQAIRLRLDERDVNEILKFWYFRISGGGK